MRLLLFAALLLLAPPAFSQEVRSDSACTYEACALRLDRIGLGVQLVRGNVPVDAPPAATSPVSRIVGALGVRPAAPLPLEDAVSASPAALAHARAWRRNGRVAGGLRSTALLTLAAAYTLSILDVVGDDARTGAALGAVGLAAASVPFGLASRRSLDRAVETYNDGLER